MSLRDKYTDEEWSKLEKNSSSRDFSPGWTERQKKHLEKVYRNINHQDCLHDLCSKCLGTGIKIDGSFCIHMISCKCGKCSPR